MRDETLRPSFFSEEQTGGVIVKRGKMFVAAMLMNKKLRVNVYVIPVIVKKIPYGVVVACMN